MFPFRILYYIGFLQNFFHVHLATSSESSPLKIIIHMATGTQSHVKGIMEIASILNKRNHTLTFASIIENRNFSQGYPVQFRSLGSSAKLDKEIHDFYSSYYDPITNVFNIPPSLYMKPFSDIIVMSYETVYPTLKELITKEKPDLLICDFFSSACGDIAELNNIPFINGLQTIDFHGVTKIPFITTDEFYGPITIDEQSFSDRFREKVFIPVKKLFQTDPIVQRLNKIKERYGVPASVSVFKDFDRNLGLSITFEGFEPAIPLPPNIKIIGPVFSEKIPKLDTNLIDFLDSRQRVLYIAFGTKGYLIRPELDKILTSLLRLIENDIIDGAVWGLGRIGLDGFSKTFSFRGSEVSIEELFSSNHTNLRLLPWVPQVPILNHPNVKLFHSHGGLESILESIHAGKPMLIMSLEADQFRNARKVKAILDDTDGLVAYNLDRLKTLSKFSSRRKYLGADLIEGYAYTAKACRPSQPHKWGEVPCEARHLVPVSYHMSFIKSELLDVYFSTVLLFLCSLSLLLFIIFKLIISLYYKIAYRHSHVKKE